MTGVSGLLPPLGPSRAARRPSSAERTLSNGLTVLAVRRPAVPLVELRLRIPFAGNRPGHRARASLLANSLLLGTARRSELELVQALQEVGTELAVGSDNDRVLISGSVLRAGLNTGLDLLAEVLTSAAYPARLVAGERKRLRDQLRIARSQPDVVARVARARRVYGKHPYAEVLAADGDVAGLDATALRRVHRQRIQPTGARLVLVGDLSPTRTLDAVEAALGGWAPGAAPVTLRPAPTPVPGPLLLVDRPGAVQSCLRLAGSAPVRTDPGYPAMQLANLVFGGYFSSRYVENIREAKGYTYTPRSSIEHRMAGSAFAVDADVSTAVTAPALLETQYELGRMATLPITEAELDSARQYALGNLALSTSTQAGLAATLAGLAGPGLGLDWIADYRRALLSVGVDDVLEQASRFLAPSRLVTVVVGDAAAIREQLGTLAEIA
ncbi:MAG: insulinase family protein [Actinomycetota bacterium]|nr:insulinase family protein [Actinomycetota bacterium]